MTNLPMLPDQNEWTQMKEVALTAIKSKLLPESIDNPDKAIMIMLKGRELGLSPMTAWAHINFIKGKLTISAEMMLASIRAAYPNAEIIFKECTDKKCVVSAKRINDKEPTIFEMTLEQAMEAGFARVWDKDEKAWKLKDPWKKQPKTMLRWRVITEMKRILWPEILMGIDYAKEELEDTDPEEQSTEQTAKDVTPKKDQNKVEVRYYNNEAKKEEPIAPPQQQSLIPDIVEEKQEEQKTVIRPVTGRNEMAVKCIALAKKIDPQNFNKYLFQECGKLFEGREMKQLLNNELKAFTEYLEREAIGK